MTELLTDVQISDALDQLPTWEVNTDKTKICQTFKTADFISGVAFLTHIAVHAEKLNHHPDIELSYGAVTVTLTTHDAGGLTERDIMLAKLISASHRAS